MAVIAGLRVKEQRGEFFTSERTPANRLPGRPANTRRRAALPSYLRRSLRSPADADTGARA